MLNIQTITRFLIGTGLVLTLILTGLWLSMDMNSDNSSLMVDRALSGQSLTKLPKGNIPSVQPTEIIELKDGDTFDLEATIVKQEVGNRTVKRLAYNGQIPGPVLKVQKGAKVTINFTNSIDMDTSLHSHGLRGKWEFDGAVPITPPVKVGETFSYELEFPDTGIYWYHPHVREDYQQEMGLYGNMIVEEENYWSNADQEEYLIVDDYLENGDFKEGVVTNAMMGRFGDTFLINDSENYNLTVQAGNITRVYITNVANTRTFNLVFNGAQMKRVGGDIGRIEQEKMVGNQIIAPAERYILELYYKKPGTYPITHRGITIGTVTVTQGTQDRQQDFKQLRANADDYSAIRANWNTYLSKAPDKNIRLGIQMKGGGGMGMMGGRNRSSNTSTAGLLPDGSGKTYTNDGIEWDDDMAMMNAMSTDQMMEWIIEDTVTGKENADIDWSFQKGDLVKIRIYNDPNSMHPMQHPIHFHGQRFIVLAQDGKANENLQWKDTVLIPKGRTVDILVDMSNPGKWMAHCHIAEHLHSGMMFRFDVTQ